MKTTNERTCQVRCENCDFVEINASDLMLVGTFETYKLYSFKCPKCGKQDYHREMKF